MRPLSKARRVIRELSAMRGGARELLDEIDRQRARDERRARASIRHYSSGTVQAAPVNPPVPNDGGNP